MPCYVCIAMKKNKDCGSCQPELLKVNYPIVDLVERYGHSMLSMGSINTHGVDMALNCEEWITEELRPKIIRYLLVYLSAVISTLNKDKKDRTDG